MKKHPRALSPVFDETLLKLELIEAMAVEDGWDNLDACLAEAPQAIGIFERHATAAMRVLKAFYAKHKGKDFRRAFSWSGGA